MGEDNGLKVSQATIADVYEQLGANNEKLESIGIRIDECNAKLTGMGEVLVEHAERLSRAETKINGSSTHGDRLVAAEVRLAGQAAHDEDAGADAGRYRQARPAERSSSDLYRAVGKRIEERGEEVTERIKLEAVAAAHKAVTQEVDRRAVEEAQRLKAESDKALLAIDLKHKRAMSKIQIVAAILGLLVSGGFIASFRTLFSTEAAQAKNAEALKRIESRQRQQVRPDAALEP